MRVLVTAKNGQLGWELGRVLDESRAAHAEWASATEALFLDSKELDITNVDQVADVLSTFNPDLVINAAAYTAVDRAESDSADAYAVNETGVGNLAGACKKLGCRLLHVSTDFVFSAEKNTPYQPNDLVAPLNVYGASKLAGERLAHEILGADAIVVRTAWVYSIHGNNFVKTMLRLMAEKEQLSVVCDQIGSPTSARLLAEALWSLSTRAMTDSSIEPIYHWTDLGTASWYDFAVAIQEFGLDVGLLQKAIPIIPIRTAEYPTPAKRPAYSVMDTSALRSVIGASGVYWRNALQSVIRELAK